MKNIIKATFLIFILIASFTAQGQYKPGVLPPHVQDSMEDNASKIIVKIDPDQQVQSNQRSAVQAKDVLDQIKETVGKKALHKVFNKNTAHQTRTMGQSRLDNIYQVQIDDKNKVIQTLKVLNDIKGVAYAELYHQNQLLYIPNDPLANPKFGNQYHLENIEAYSAWGEEQGDSSIVVGIVDTGVDLDHSDLEGNIAYNYDDPINGTDDDGDGYIDNFMGWDVADNDNDPSADVNGHGTAVSGMSSAHTNNNDGIAGTGFNSKYLPVKILADENNKLLREYEGIVYAAEHGAKVINLSWGGAWNYSEFGKDVIDYVVLEKDVVVVAAAGNTHEEIDFYPASYDNVLSVGASTEDDELATWATYSYKMDLMAPGHNVFTTKNDNKYGSAQGSSFAAPAVAGAAALVRNKFPDLDARQVMQQIRVTADDVYDLSFNQNFEGQLGKGRLNMYRALADTLTPSVRINNIAYETNYGDKIFRGDTITIYPSFINYLRTAKNLTITLKTANSNVTGNDGVYSVSTLNAYSTFDKVKEEGWKVVVGEDVKPGSHLLFKVELEADNYSDFEYFQFHTTPEYFDIESKSLQVTVSSDGDLGYDSNSFTKGNGVWYGNDQIANHLGIMITKNTNQVMDNVIESYSPFEKSLDFQTQEYLRLYNNSVADQDGRSAFGASEDVENKLGVDIEQKVLSWDKNGSGNYLVLEYRIVNTADSALNDVNMGLFVDWDISDRSKNTAGWESDSKMAWATSNDGSEIYTGISLLSSGDSTFYAVDLDNQNGNIADFENIFEDSKKHELNTAGMIKTQAGLNGGNDIAHLLALNGININAKSSKKMAFVMMVGQDKQKLKDLVAEAKMNYEKYRSAPPVDEQYFTCENDDVEIDFESNTMKEFYVDPDLSTRLDSSYTYTTTELNHDTSYYFVRVEDGIRSDVRTVDVNIKHPNASFWQSDDTLFIENGSYDKVSFLNNSETTTDWFWDFGNGFQATVENPSTQYEESGLYEVLMEATNEIGCVDTVTSEVFVAVRSPKPEVSDQLICKGSFTDITAENTDNIRVYADSDLSEKLFEGQVYTTGTLTSGQVYYITNIEDWESNPVEVKVNISHPEPKFDFSIDTTDLNEKTLVYFENTSEYAPNSNWYVNGDFESDGNSISVDYAGSEATEVKLTASDSLQCKDSAVYTIDPQVSDQPGDIDVISCGDQSLTIQPEEEGIFYYYSDESLKNLIHKGETLNVEMLNADTILYYTAIDQYLESKPATITINNLELKAKIDASSQTLDLTQESEVTLTDVSVNADWSYWYRKTGTIDTSTVLLEPISAAGEIEFTLVAGNDYGCVDTAVATVNAELITGLGDFSGEVTMFPNPASDQFDIKLDGASFTNPSITLVDMKGSDVLNEQYTNFYQNQLTVSTTGIKPGIYLVIIRDKSLQIQSRISIKH